MLEPVIKPKGIDDVPIVALTLTSERDDMGAADLQKVAHALEIELKRVAGTREVTTLGGPDEVVRVTLDPERMNAHRVTATDIERALKATNASMPAGDLTRGSRTVEVRTGQFLADARDVGQLIVGVTERRPVLLADVAQVSSARTRPLVTSGTARRKPELTASAPSSNGPRSRSRFPRNRARTPLRSPTR